MLGFKSAITLYAGSFFISVVKLFYKVPRPYWIDGKIDGKECLMDFSGPSDNQFFMVFFYSYNIVIFLILYSEKSHTMFAALLLSVNAFAVVIAALCLNYLGTCFYLESITGVIYGLIFSSVCLALDSEIHRVSEMTAFIVRTSKKYKFYMLFVSLVCFCCVVVYYNSELITWRAPQPWIVNSLEECSFDRNFEVRLGIDDTFKETSAIFGLIGVSFGASHATKTIDNVTWAYTALWKRVLRGLIGITLYVGIFVGFYNIPAVDLPTAYFFNQILPHLLATFMLYAYVPILSKYIGLVQKRDRFSAKKEDALQMEASKEYSGSDDEGPEEEKNPGDLAKRAQTEKEKPLISPVDKKKQL